MRSSARSGVLTAALLLLAVLLGASPAASAPSRAPVRVMIVGDSITQGSTGDYTWRYRFAAHYSAGSIDLVGGSTHLRNLASESLADHSDHSYADPYFDQAHEAYWGRPLLGTPAAIAPQIARYAPDYVLVLLGFNDLIFKATPAELSDRMRSFVATVRAQRPSTSIVIGLLTPNIVVDKALLTAVNSAYRQLAAELSTPTSRITIADPAAQGFDATQTVDTWDGLHPNARGEIKIAAAFAQGLAQAGFGSPFRSLPTPAMQRVPDAPHLSVTAADGAAIESWTWPARAFNYWIEVKQASDPTWTRLPFAWEQRTFTAGGLTNEVPYAFRIVPIGKGGYGPPSNVVTLTPTGRGGVRASPSTMNPPNPATVSASPSPSPSPSPTMATVLGNTASGATAETGSSAGAPLAWLGSGVVLLAGAGWLVIRVRRWMVSGSPEP